VETPGPEGPEVMGLYIPAWIKWISRTWFVIETGNKTDKRTTATKEATNETEIY
jgi:hypothetical protein